MNHLKNEALLLEFLNHKKMIAENKKVTLDFILKSLSETLTELLKDKGELISHIKAEYEQLGQSDTQVLSMTPIPLGVYEEDLEDVYWIMIMINSTTTNIYISNKVYDFIDNKALIDKLAELEKLFLFNVYNKEDENFIAFNIDYTEDAEKSVRLYDLSYYQDENYKEMILISYDKTEDDEVIIRPVYQEDIEMDINTLYHIAKEVIINKNANALMDFIKDSINREMELGDEDQIQVNVELDASQLDEDETCDIISTLLEDLKALETDIRFHDEEVDELFKQLNK